jgi:hypothetical protein
MNIFTIEIDSTVTGFWGWGLLFILLVSLAACVALAGLAQVVGGKHKDFPAQAAVVVLIATFFVGCGNFGIWPSVERETRAEAINAALEARGLNDPITVDDGIYVLTSDGDAAIYTTLAQGNTITFYQTTE